MIALFAGEVFYPRGGWHDMLGMFDTYEEAVEAFETDAIRVDWGQVVDLETGEVLAYLNSQDVQRFRS